MLRWNVASVWPGLKKVQLKNKSLNYLIVFSDSFTSYTLHNFAQTILYLLRYECCFWANKEKAKFGDYAFPFLEYEKEMHVQHDFSAFKQQYYRFMVMMWPSADVNVDQLR